MDTTTDAPRLLRAKEVAAMLDCSPERVRRLVRQGKLHSVRLGPDGWHRFRPEDVERLISPADEK